MGNIFKIPSLEALYSMLYDAGMTEWRRLGSLDKVESIELALHSAGSPGIQSVLEVGCGEGPFSGSLRPGDWVRPSRASKSDRSGRPTGKSTLKAGR